MKVIIAYDGQVRCNSKCHLTSITNLLFLERLILRQALKLQNTSCALFNQTVSIMVHFPAVFFSVFNTRTGQG